MAALFVVLALALGCVGPPPSLHRSVCCNRLFIGSSFILLIVSWVFVIINAWGRVNRPDGFLNATRCEQTGWAFCVPDQLLLKHSRCHRPRP